MKARVNAKVLGTKGTRSVPLQNANASPLKVTDDDEMD
jgi:hypothetical protein